MRLRATRLALLLAVAALPGCFLNEIDKSMENYEGGPGKRAAREAKEAAEAQERTARAPGKPGDAKPAGPSWWETARTLGSDPKNEAIAGCQLGGRVEYMLRDDCLSRGGQPQ
jgi:hypothetical protein